MNLTRALTCAVALCFLAAAHSGCKRRGSSDDPPPPPPNPMDDCPAVDTHLGSAGDGGAWSAAGTLCAGASHQYRVNAGCNPGGPIGSLPACGACTLSATVTYGDDVDPSVAIRQHNDGVQLAASSGSTSPEAAEALNDQGGTLAVVVHNPGGAPAAYTLALDYTCN